MQIVSKIDGFDGVEMVFPYENSDPETTRKWMDDVNLNLAAIFDVTDFFNRHSEITLGAFNLAKSLNHQQILEMMHEEN